MKRPAAYGYTLIELMVVVAIVSILAAVATPAYHDFVVRARVAEGIQALAPYKTKVAEQYFTTGELPAQHEDFVIGGTGIVARVAWSAGRHAIEVWFGPDAGPELEGRILWLRPSESEAGVTWTCLGHSGDGGSQWTMPKQYMPSSCRG